MPDKRYVFPFEVLFCGYYAGICRAENPNPRTRLLYQSKFHKNLEARAAIVEEMADKAGGLWFDAITYASRRDAKIDHARLLAQGIGERVNRRVFPSSYLARFDLRQYRILLVDDVLDTGTTLRKVWLRLLPCTPAGLYGLVYLKTSW